MIAETQHAKLDWGDLEVFLAVHRRRRLRTAAEVLGVNASTVSRRLAALEDSLGVELFSRTPEGLTPTAAAEALLPAAEQVEAAALGAVRDLCNFEASPAGTVRVALPEGIGVHVIAPELRRLTSAYPDLRLDLLCRPEIADLSRLEADIAVRVPRPERGDLVHKRVTTMQSRVLGSAQYLRANRRADPEALDWIAYSASSTAPESRWYARYGPRIDPLIRTTSLNVAVQAVRSGVGVAVLPRSLQRTFSNLREVDFPAERWPETPFWLVTHRSLRGLPRIRAVWDFLEQCLGGLGDTVSD